jgi:mRNA interferase RelE/StbE
LAWTIEFEDDAKRQLAKIDKQAAKRIVAFLRERLALHENPRQLGAALKGNIRGAYWRYRVGDYRIVCDIQDQRLVVVVIEIGHRREIYR